MIRIRDTRYDDRSLAGSLQGAMRMWQGLDADPSGAAPFSLHFTYACRSEARARRVAVALRRRMACAAARVVPCGRLRSQVWHVQGGTHAQPQSLPNLEQLSNWLRDVGSAHQVALVRLSLA